MWTTGEILGVAKGKSELSRIVLAVPAAFADKIYRWRAATVSLRLDDGRFISENQRKKIYATLNEISEYTGYPPEQAKQVMKYEHIARTGSDYFSLSTCSMSQAGRFLDTLIDFCLENGVQMKDSLWERADDLSHALYSCLKYKKCAVCGRTGEIHHWDAIGMGKDRRIVDDRWHRKICLCREHHSMAHSMGSSRFAEKYHVYGIIYNEERKEEREDAGIETGKHCERSTSGTVPEGVWEGAPEHEGSEYVLQGSQKDRDHADFPGE